MKWEALMHAIKWAGPLACLSLPSAMSRMRSDISIWKLALTQSCSPRIKKVGRELNVFIKIVEVGWNWCLISFCKVNFSNFPIHTSCRNSRRGAAIRALLYGPAYWLLCLFEVCLSSQLLTNRAVGLFTLNFVTFLSAP